MFLISTAKIFINMERRRTVGILGQDALVAVERLRLALVVDGLDAELVPLARLEAGDLGVGCVPVGPRGRLPATGRRVHLLDDVAGDRQAAVVLGLLPLELAVALVDVCDLQRTLRTTGLVWNGVFFYQNVTKR